MKKMTLNDRMIDWTIRLIFKGDMYGKTNSCIHNEERPLVEFFDNRYSIDSDSEGNVLGQFVTRYYVNTILGIKNENLNLCGYEPDWSISASGISKVQKFIRENA